MPGNYSYEWHYYRGWLQPIYNLLQYLNCQACVAESRGCLSLLRARTRFLHIIINPTIPQQKPYSRICKKSSAIFKRALNYPAPLHMRGRKRFHVMEFDARGSYLAFSGKLRETIQEGQRQILRSSSENFIDAEKSMVY